MDRGNSGSEDDRPKKDSSDELESSKYALPGKKKYNVKT